MASILSRSQCVNTMTSTDQYKSNGCSLLLDQSVDEQRVQKSHWTNTEPMNTQISMERDHPGNMTYLWKLVLNVSDTVMFKKVDLKKIMTGPWTAACLAYTRKQAEGKTGHINSLALMMNFCVIIGSCNGLLPIWQQAITWTNADSVSTPLPFE